MTTNVTNVWKVDVQRPSVKALEEAAALLRDGKTVAFPTETVYGLGADARNTEAVSEIFAAKGRPSDNPLIVHIADRSQLEELTAPPEEAILRLLDRFWPGPLTVVLPVKPGVLSPLVTAGLHTVGIRMPNHPVALGLIAAAGCPIAAPSANRSGRPSPTNAIHVLEDLEGRIAGVVDSGPTGVGLESTVVEYIRGAIHILRPGGITEEQLREALPDIPVFGHSEEEGKYAKLEKDTPRAPGMKYKHYAPRGTMLLIQGNDRERILSRMKLELDRARHRGERTGVLTYREHSGQFQADHIAVCGSLSDPNSIAHGLYAALRKFDDADIDFIVAEACPETGMGAVIMNRMRKAAGERIVTV